jgi:P pilus assembly chaperone PapD
VAFAPPFSDAAGMSLTVLRPEKVKGGVRFTIAVTNTSDAPITVDTGAVGPHDPRFNDVAVPMTMTPVLKRLAPGEGYSYQCVLKLPTMNLGQLAFTIGQVALTGQAAGD